MKNDTDFSLGACGLTCEDCDIVEAGTNIKLAIKICDWLRNEKGITDIKPEDIHCNGCKGNREQHWSADCYILRCCIDGKHLDNCSQCNEFPCEYLINWSNQNERYSNALKKLISLKEGIVTEKKTE